MSPLQSVTPFLCHTTVRSACPAGKTSKWRQAYDNNRSDVVVFLKTDYFGSATEHFRGYSNVCCQAIFEPSNFS